MAFAHDGYFAAANIKVADTGKLLWNALRWYRETNTKPRVGLIDGSEACGALV